MAKKHPELQDRRRYRDLPHILAAISQVAVRQRPDEPFHLSVRELALAAAINPKTAAKYLKVLVAFGLLRQARWTDWDNARHFTLRIPANAHKWHSHPPTSMDAYDNGIDVGGDGGLCQLWAPLPDLDWRVSSLRRHSAFVRGSGCPSLPPSCADLLIAIERGATTRSEVTRRSGRSREAVRKGLMALESAGIIEKSESGTFTLTSPSAVTALDEWCRAMGIPDRAMFKEERFEDERERFRQRRKDRGQRPRREC
jgi:predicted transcriptional regulator